MSKKIFEMVRNTDLRDVELQLILQCAPMLSGLKCSNLLKIGKNLFKRLSKILKDAGISYYVIFNDSKNLIVLVYHKENLVNYLLRPDIRRFLTGLGYSKKFSLTAVLFGFRKRYCEYLIGSGSFPHEMGILLGYPLKDVEGFIDNSGKNYLYSGYWKVYSDSNNAKKLFKSFDMAKDIMLSKYFSGINISNIIKPYQVADGYRMSV